MSQLPPPPPPPFGAAPPPPPPGAPSPAGPWGRAPQPFPPSSEIRPSTAWYWIGAGIGFVCVLVGIVLIVRSAVSYVDKIDDFQRVSVPGSDTVSLEEGSYTVYAESGISRDMDSWSFNGSVEIRDPQERLVELRRYGSRTTYDVDDREGLALWSFHADETGDYRVTTTGNPNAWVAVGKGLGAGIVGGALGGVGLIVAGGLFALITIVVTAVRRGSARRRQLATAFQPPRG